MSFEGFHDVLYQPVTDDVAVVECDDPDTVDPFQHLHNGHQTRIATPRQVDLRDVAGNDKPGVAPHAGQEHFDLGDRRILRFVQDDESVVERPLWTISRE